MTIEQLIKQLQQAIEDGFKPDTRICVDTMPDITEQETYWGISLDTDSSVYPDKDQWKIAINVYPYTGVPSFGSELLAESKRDIIESWSEDGYLEDDDQNDGMAKTKELAEGKSDLLASVAADLPDVHYLDMPSRDIGDLDNLTLEQLVYVAQHECKHITESTNTALQALTKIEEMAEAMSNVAPYVFNPDDSLLYDECTDKSGKHWHVLTDLICGNNNKGKKDGND